jgi:hypothetical protein
VEKPWTPSKNSKNGSPRTEHTIDRAQTLATQSTRPRNRGRSKLTTLEVEAHGDSAHEVGAYELSDASGKVLDRGKYVVIWKRDAARWKLHRDIWTTSQAPAKP